MADKIDIPPFDSHNQKLVNNVHPGDWVNPRPAERYHLVVVGAGTAGLVSAAIAAGLGARVALVERELLGGDCLNVGCVPSKALIRASRVAAEVRDAASFGVEVPGGVKVNFAAVMERMRRLRADISDNDSAARFKSLGVDLFLGSARFISPEAVSVDDKTLNFKKAVLATGARPARPLIPGLEEAGFLTNETIFELTELPARLAVIGAGPLGCELSQAFARFGSKVTLFDRNDHILPREDADAAAIVGESLVRDGIQIITSCQLESVEKRDRAKVLPLKCGGSSQQVEADEILVAAGRVPNVDGLNLEAAGIAYDTKRGVQVNDRLQTSNSRVFAAGDICSRFKFTHAADAMARLVIRNALFPISGKASDLTIPWCTYTDPEIAHVGLYEDEAIDQGMPIQTFMQELKHVDRAILDGGAEGFVKIHVRKGKDKIVGATVVAQHAGEMISELTLAMVNKIGLGKIGNVIHPYPTQAEAIRKLGDQYTKTRLTPLVKWLLSKLIGA